MGKRQTTIAQQPTPDHEATEVVWELHEGPSDSRKLDPEKRMPALATAIVDLAETLPSTRAANHVADQILRSGPSPCPSHGEAESAESRDALVHKLKAFRKEPRASRRWARLIQRMVWAPESSSLLFVLGESEELIRIFQRRVQTARGHALDQSKSAPASPCGPV
jgi:four helix bundle protein